MVSTFQKSEPSNKRRISTIILLVLTFFILSSQFSLVAQAVPVSNNQSADNTKVFQDCMLDGGKQTNLPNGGSECCVGKYCTRCTNGQCSTICNYRKQGYSKPGPGCLISLRENIETSPTAAGVMAPITPSIEEEEEVMQTFTGKVIAPAKPPTRPPGMPGPTIPPNKPPTKPLVAPTRYSSQPVPSAPGVLVPITTMGTATNVARVSNASSLSKFNRCLDAKGSKVFSSGGGGGDTTEKCCYPRNKTTGLKTCIKCIYPGGNAGKAICTKNQFKSVADTPKVGTQNLPTTNAPPKPLTQMEKMKKGYLNPVSTPGKMMMPEAKPLEEAPTGGYKPIVSPETYQRMQK